MTGISNTFDNVTYSIAVNGGNINTSTGVVNVTSSDIKWYQCYSSGNQNAMNYWQNMPTGYYRYIYVNSAYSDLIAAGYKYQYSCTNTTGYYPPINSYNPYYVAINILSESSCPSTLLMMAESSIPSLISQTEDYSETENYLNEELDNLTSYNDLSLSISAQSANDNNTAEVYSQLSSASPYLTSEILLAYLENPNVPELSKVSLMLENSPLPTDVVEAIENSDLSTEYINYILKQQDGVNEIEQLQNRISGLQSARQVNYDHLMRATFNADTTEVFVETYNYVMEFMQNQNDYHAKNRLVDMYIHSQMWDEALNLLSAMESSLSVDDIAIANDIHLNEVKIDILQNLNTEPIADIVKRHDEFLTEMAADYNTKEGGVARAILESAGLMENFPIVFLPNPDADSEVSTKSARVSEPIQEPAKSGKELAAMFKLYPNPANDYLSLEFINPAGNCSFNIYTLKGELVKSISSEQSLGFISINISNLQPGNYIINCPELNSNQNFMIVR